MITGKDPISLQVLEAFTKKRKLTDIAASFNLSLDQVKRLKRLYNYTNTVPSLTNEQMTEQFKTAWHERTVPLPLHQNQRHPSLNGHFTFHNRPNNT